MNLRIRLVTEADTEEFHRYWTELLNESLSVLVPFPKTPTLEQNTQFVRSHSDGEKSIMFVAAQEGTIRGVIHLTRIERPMLDHTVNMGLNVQREYRRQGNGGQLLKKAVG